MKTSSKRILFILLSLAFLLGSAFIYSSFITSAYQEVTQLRAQLITNTDTLNKYQKTLSQVKGLLNSLQNSADVQRQASLILPQSKDVSYLTNQLVGLSRVNGLDLESVATQVAPVQPSKSSIIKSIGRLKGDFRLSGSYAGFKAFLKQIENNILILDINDLKVEGSTKAETVSGLKYSISITSYYQAE